MQGKKISSKKITYVILILLIISFFSLNIAYALPKNNEVIKKDDIVKAPIKENPQIVPQEKPIKHIILIIVDGVELGIFDKLNLPNLKGLWSTGIRTNQAISVFPPDVETITENLLTGKDNLIVSEDTKNTSNLIEIIKNSNKKTAFIDNTSEKLGPLIKSSDTLMSIPNTNNKEVIDKSIEIIKEKEPYFLGLTLRNSVSPEKKAMSKDFYHKSIVDLDNQIGRLIYNLTEIGVYDNTLTVLVGINNYNNKTKSHLDKESMLNSLIIRGPGIKTEERVSPIALKDVMPTINFLFNGKVNDDIDGKVLWNIIRKQGYTDGYFMNKRVKDLSNEQVKSYFNILKMKENKKELLKEQKKVREEKHLVKNIINEKDRQIRDIELKFKLVKYISGLVIIILILGYFIEYYLLRKRFLLF